MSLPSPGLRQTLALERYSFRRKLGAGSLGSVYLVFDERSGREGGAEAHPQRSPVVPGGGAAPAPDKTPPAGRHHVRASEALEQGGAPGQRQGPVTTENPRSKAAKPAGKQAQPPENLSLTLEIDWDKRKATLSVGDEKPLKLVLDGDTWRPVSDAG